MLLPRILKIQLNLLLTICAASSCGRKSSSSDSSGSGSSGGYSSNMQNLTGTITSQSGTSALMKGWAVALVEHDTGVSRIAEADASGVLKWKMVSFDSAQTAILLSPDYLIQSVVALPSATTKTVKQFFKIGSSTLPQIVQKGSTMTFQTMTGLTVQEYLTKDTDGDGVPDAMGSLGLVDQSKGLSLSSVDTDKDGLVNELDTDMDGDGLMNGFDSDEDGDTTLDVFDADANGNNVTDSQETYTDAYYNQGIEYFTARYEQGASTNNILFLVKVRDGVTPASVKIKTASSFTASSTALATDGSSAAWDLSLADDGASNDGAAKDLLYGRKVQLASGIAPRANQVFFAQVTIGTGDSAFTLEFPWTFPNVTLSAITSSYDTSTRIVTLSGNPFGTELQSFLWGVSVKDSSGVKIYESPTIAGTTRTLTIPSNIMKSATSYTYEVVAQSLDKVPGVPALAVRSDVTTITTP